MNSDSEAINAFLAWLLQEQQPTVSAPSGDSSDPIVESDGSGIFEPQQHPIDPFDSEDLAELDHPFSESNHFSIEAIPFYETGEIPAVQDRFYTLIKKRLQAEIERKPPLFPWESEVCDYESEVNDVRVPELVPLTLWTTQLESLQIPVPMPEALLTKLFQQCQNVVSESLREGSKLVRAVEALFPGHTQSLNELAGLVLTSPVRGKQAALSGVPNYDAATLPQQMALSLIAAREILTSLTLTLSAEQTNTQRQWATAQGLLTLKAEAASADLGHLRIQGEFPCSGRLQLEGMSGKTTAQRSTPGYLSVELFDLQPNRVYPLEVRLSDQEEAPLVFAVHPVATSERA